MIIKTIVVITFLLIIASLGSALYHLVRHREHENSEKTAKALTLRITLSLILFIFVFIAIFTGILKPHGIGSAMHARQQTSSLSMPETDH
ncbi:MAG: twin transmembrane helix small protein [Gammaproteobacteria bacterium]